ncbi:hypothetical protein RYX36_018453, partial [Vicia faba]
APSMTHSKNAKGKVKMDEISNAPDSDLEQVQPSVNQCILMAKYQGVIDFVSDSGLYYQYLVIDFYAHLSILLGCAFSFVVRGGYTLELVYKKLHEIDIHISSELHAYTLYTYHLANLVIHLKVQ